MSVDDLCCCHDSPFLAALNRHGIEPGRWPTVRAAFPQTRGRVIAVARLVACLPTGRGVPPAGCLRWAGKDLCLSEQERGFGNYGPGRSAWVFRDPIRLVEPAPATGALGLWEWEPPPGSLGPCGVLDALTADVSARRERAGVGR